MYICTADLKSEPIPRGAISWIVQNGISTNMFVFLDTDDSLQERYYNTTSPCYCIVKIGLLHDCTYSFRTDWDPDKITGYRSVPATTDYN